MKRPTRALLAIIVHGAMVGCALAFPYGDYERGTASDGATVASGGKEGGVGKGGSWASGGDAGDSSAGGGAAGGGPGGTVASGGTAGISSGGIAGIQSGGTGGGTGGTGGGTGGTGGTAKTCTTPSDCGTPPCWSCDAGACTAKAGVGCGDACTSGVHSSFGCNAAGQCVASGSEDCAPYLCKGAICGKACNSSNECTNSSDCETASCVTCVLCKQQLENPVTNPHWCQIDSSASYSALIADCCGLCPDCSASLCAGTPQLPSALCTNCLSQLCTLEYSTCAGDAAE